MVIVTWQGYKYLFKVSPIPCLHLVVREKVDQLSLLLNVPLTMFVFSGGMLQLR